MKAEEEIQQKDGRKREIAYPAYSLDEALKVAQAVSELGGSRVPVAKKVLAKHLDYAETGPSFFQRITAAKCFKLVSGWGAYSLTQPAQLYFFPTSEADRKVALISFLKAPEVFGKLVARFDGAKLPSVEMLGNMLHNDSGVPISWKDKVASLFIKSAQFAGVVDASGNLRITLRPLVPLSSLPKIGQTNDLEAKAADMNFTATQPQVAPLRRSSPEGGPIRTWEFADGDKVLRVETPSQLSSDLWRLLENYVQYLKPKEESK